MLSFPETSGVCRRWQTQEVLGPYSEHMFSHLTLRSRGDDTGECRHPVPLEATHQAQQWACHPEVQLYDVTLGLGSGVMFPQENLGPKKVRKVTCMALRSRQRLPLASPPHPKVRKVSERRAQSNRLPAPLPSPSFHQAAHTAPLLPPIYDRVQATVDSGQGTRGQRDLVVPMLCPANWERAEPSEVTDHLQVEAQLCRGEAGGPERSHSLQEPAEPMC